MSSCRNYKEIFSRQDFIRISNSITDMEVDSHLVDLVFILFDENQDQRMSIEEFSPILAGWRLSRSFMQASTSGASIMDLRLS